MQWKPISELDARELGDQRYLLVWCGDHWDQGRYTKRYGWQICVEGDVYNDESITHYLLIEPPPP